MRAGEAIEPAPPAWAAERLRELGYRPQGARWLPPDRLYPWELGGGREVVGRVIRWAEATDSTNADLLGASEWSDGEVRLAEAQRAGRGRRGRVWQAPAGRGLLCSIALAPSLDRMARAAYTVLAGVAIAEGLEARYGLRPRLKWPNDVLIGDRKLCGILLEAQLEQDPADDRVVIGFGLNANQRAEELPPRPRYPATSLALELGHPVDRRELLRDLLGALDARVVSLRADGLAPLEAAWRARSGLLGAEVCVRAGAETLRGVAVGLSFAEGVTLRMPGGQRRSVRGEHASAIERVGWPGAG